MSVRLPEHVERQIIDLVTALTGLLDPNEYDGHVEVEVDDRIMCIVDGLNLGDSAPRQITLCRIEARRRSVNGSSL